MIRNEWDIWGRAEGDKEETEVSKLKLKGDIKEMDTKTRRLGGILCENRKDGRITSEGQKRGGSETTIFEWMETWLEADSEINGCGDKRGSVLWGQRWKRYLIQKCYANIFHHIPGVLLSSKQQINFNSPLSDVSNLLLSFSSGCLSHFLSPILLPLSSHVLPTQNMLFRIKL